MEGKTYSYQQIKERNPQKIYQEYSQNSNDYKDPLDDELLKEEYENYKNYLMIKKECPACHFIQGMIFTGVGFFCFARMIHFRQTFNRMDFLKLFAIAVPCSAFGLYKFSYTKYVFEMKNRMEQLNKFIAEK